MKLWGLPEPRVTHNNSIDYPQIHNTMWTNREGESEKDIEQSVFITVKVFLCLTLKVILTSNNNIDYPCIHGTNKIVHPLERTYWHTDNTTWRSQHWWLPQNCYPSDHAILCSLQLQKRVECLVNWKVNFDTHEIRVT